MKAKKQKFKISYLSLRGFLDAQVPADLALEDMVKVLNNRSKCYVKLARWTAAESDTNKVTDNGEKETKVLCVPLLALGASLFPFRWSRRGMHRGRWGRNPYNRFQIIFFDDRMKVNKGSR